MKAIPDKIKKIRVLTCPFCRQPEKHPGLRSRTSYETEIKYLYSLLKPRDIPPDIYIPPTSDLEQLILASHLATQNLARILQNSR